MYQVEKELNLVTLGKILNNFQTTELPKLKQYYNYYIGKQAITNKVATDKGKPCNKIVSNYCRSITENYLGYIAGVPITYSSEQDNFTAVQEILNYNDFKAADTEFLRQALIYGKAFEICYIDEDNKQRFKTLDTKQCIDIYDNTIEKKLLYVVRFWKTNLYDKANEEQYRVEIYSKDFTRVYDSAAGFSSFKLIDERPNFYKQCPITVFDLNKENESIFGQIITLQDCYNTLLSSSVDDWESFTDCYLLLKGMIADQEDLDRMKEHRVLMLDSDADASYLTKNINDTQIQNMLSLVDEQIYTKSSCPNFSAETFGASSGVALRYRLLQFENVAGSIESNFKEALQKRLELICSYLSLIDSDIIWRDVKIQFVRNLPMNIEEQANIINSLRGVVSNETLLSLLPFVTNPQEELEKVEEERKNNINLYNFGDET